MADSVPITSIKIEATADTSKAEKSIERLASKLQSLKNAVKGGIKLPDEEKIASFANAIGGLKNVEWNNIAKGIDEIASAMERLANVRIDPTVLREFVNFAKVYKSYAKAQKSAANAASAAQPFQAPAVTRGTALSTNVVNTPRSNIIEGEWREAPTGTTSEDVQEKTNKIEQVSSAMKNLGTTMKTVAGIAKTLGGYVMNYLVSALEAAAKAAWAVTKELGKLFLSSMSSVASTMGRVALSAAKMTASIAIAPWKRLASSIGSTVKRMTGFLAAAKRIAMYRAIRWALKEITKAFKEGIANLYQYSKLINGEFARSMDLLATDALYVKDSLAAMVSPIINNLAPAIDMITDKFVDLLNTVNETLAAMTGADTWTAALKYPIEYAEAADDASGAAKKLRNTILGFDEINRLDDKTKSKRGSTKDNLDYSKMFEERKVESKIKGFFSKLKDSFKAGDMNEIGSNIGNAIMGGLDKIPWGTIEAKVKRNASSVATLLNGLISVDGLGTKLGESIAKAFNLAVSKMSTFFNTVDWSGVGNFLADGINGIVNTFDVEGLGANFASIINAAANAISGFANNVNWAAIGTFLSNGIKGVIDNFDIVGLANSIVSLFSGAVTGITALVNNVPWADLGSFLASGVNTIFTNFDTEALGEAIGGLFKSAVDGIGSFAANVEWGKLGTFLANGINGIFTSFSTDPPIGQSIAKVLNGGVTAIGQFVDDVKFEEIGTFLGDNINSFLSTFEIKDLGKTIAKVVNKGWKAINNFISEVEWSKLGTFLSDGINGYLDEINTKAIGETISKALVGIINAAKDFIKQTDFEKVGEKIGELFAGIDWKSVLSGLGDLIVDAIVASLKALKGIWEKAPLLAGVLGISIANLISTALGFPKVTTIIGNAVSTAISSGATSAGGAVGALASGGAIPVMLVGVAAAAALLIWKMQDKKAEKNVHALEPYAGAMQDEMTDPELYKQRMYNLSLGRDIDAPLTQYEKKLASAGAGLPKNTKINNQQELEMLEASGMLDIGKPKPVDVDTPTYSKSFYNDMVALGLGDFANGYKAMSADISATATNTKSIADAAKEGSSKLSSIKERVDKIKATIVDNSGTSNPMNIKDPKTPTAVKKAAGGGVTTGSLFIAGEAGAEIVSAQSGHTSVHNRDQIADSVAIGNEESNALLRQLVSVGNALLAKDTTVVTPITTGEISNAMNRQNIREGRAVIPVALGG